MFDSEKDKKKKFEWRESKGIEERRQNNEECVIWFLFVFLKKDFWSVGGIKPGIRRYLKTDSTDREESRQPKSFSLKTGFFRSVEK